MKSDNAFQDNGSEDARDIAVDLHDGRNSAEGQIGSNGTPDSDQGSHIADDKSHGGLPLDNDTVHDQPLDANHLNDQSLDANHLNDQPLDECTPQQLQNIDGPDEQLHQDHYGKLQEEFRRIQDGLDDKYGRYIKKEYELKHEHYKSIKPILDERDRIMNERMSREERDSMVRAAFDKFEDFYDYFPLNPKEERDISFIKFFKVELLPNETIKILFELYPNDYVSNETLEKIIYLFDKESEASPIEWKDEKAECGFFNFFETDEDDLETFDIINELYVNLIFYAALED